MMGALARWMLGEGLREREKMKETGGRWRKGGGGRTVIKMRAEEKAHVRNKQKCVLTEV